MTRVNITEKVWYDPAATKYVMLDISEAIPPQSPVSIDGELLLPKEEYHVSLVAAARITETLAQADEVIAGVTEYLQANPQSVAFAGLGEERYVCRDGEQMTLIAPVVVLGLEGLRRVVERHVPDYQPISPHVTLLKNAASLYGIGINSEADFRKLCERVDLGEV